MLILSDRNAALDTDKITTEDHYWVLSFQDYKNPDFFVRSTTKYLEEFNSASITLVIGTYTLVMPLHWCILCTDQEYVQSIPLYELNGRAYDVFCFNPVDGYLPSYYSMRTRTIFPNTTWTTPPIADKDMIVVPLGEPPHRPNVPLVKGPMCAIFSPNKIEVNRPLSEIW